MNKWEDKGTNALNKVEKLKTEKRRPEAKITWLKDSSGGSCTVQFHRK